MTNGWWRAMRCLIVAAIGVPALAACGGGVPHPTNPAVQACETAADKQGLEVLDQQTVTPIGQNGYRIDFMVTDKKGDRRVTCDWDPSSGARVGDLR
jgi:hypothetical protein